MSKGVAPIWALRDESGIVLTLPLSAAELVKRILNRVGGSPETQRGTIDSIIKELERVGVYGDAGKDGHGIGGHMVIKAEKRPESCCHEPDRLVSEMPDSPAFWPKS